VISRPDKKAIATLGPGDAFGELAVLDAGPRSATVLTLEETEVLRIGSEEFYEVLQEQTELAEGVIRVLTQRLRNAAEPVSPKAAERASVA
jgi:CRP-like cAMP-binding protein